MARVYSSPSAFLLVLLTLTIIAKALSQAQISKMQEVCCDHISVLHCQILMAEQHLNRSRNICRP